MANKFFDSLKDSLGLTPPEGENPTPKPDDGKDLDENDDDEGDEPDDDDSDPNDGKDQPKDGKKSDKTDDQSDNPDDADDTDDNGDDSNDPDSGDTSSDLPLPTQGTSSSPVATDIGAPIVPIMSKKGGTDMSTYNYNEYGEIQNEFFQCLLGAPVTPRVRTEIAKILDRDEALSKALLHEKLENLLQDPANVAFAKEAIKKAADSRPDPVKRLFVNKVDKNDATEYDTWEKAVASVKDNPYVSDPKDVFVQIWRLIDAEGNLGARVTEEDIKKYAESFDGDREAFLKRMGIVKKPANSQSQSGNHQDNNQKQPKPGKGKKPNKGGKPNNHSGNGGNTD